MLLNEYSQFRIIVWYRHPVAIAASAMSTLKKSGFVNQPGLADVWTYLFNFKDLVNSWGRVFGLDNIVVRPYYENRENLHELINDFFNFEGAQELLQSIRWNFSDVPINTSLDASDIIPATCLRVSKEVINRLPLYKLLLNNTEIDHLLKFFALSNNDLLNLIPDIDLPRFLRFSPTLTSLL